MDAIIARVQRPHRQLHSKRINRALYVEWQSTQRDTGGRAGRGSRARYISSLSLPLLELFSSPDLLSVAAHCHFHAGLEGFNAQISRSRFLFSREVFLRADVLLPESRAARTARNIVPNLRNGREHARSACTDSRGNNSLRDTDSAEGHCYPTTMYCLLYAGIVVVESQYSRTNVEWPFL